MPEMETPLHVLLLNNEADDGEPLHVFLQQHGIKLTVLTRADDLENHLERERPALIVLDLTMPVIDTLSALKTLRRKGKSVPVIVLTAHRCDIDRLLELKLGADDYLGKPFTSHELLARIEAVIQGPCALPRDVEACRFGPFTLDFATRTLLRERTPLKITESEYALLVVFTQHPMQVLSRAQLVELLHGPHAAVSERGIDVPVWRLRRLLEDNPGVPRRIQTLRGAGYMFVPDDGYWA
ncbi:osmolarity response regulator [Caballeronia hypogeia]|uniref:Osmolarity response regulator n=1 Tax=Caballeronia hypogeia TaxID=1777140 RepID=A0A158DRB8_9BURK|nr:winged helix-turn-helix domain-containing protein [Caballeronia hypogeia]SAK97189.1 osmolarity response regulator [Caballeronia hypogeia]